MQLIDFPLEILEQVIAASIPIHPCPSSVLCVSRVFYRLGMRTLHLNLRFVSSVQIALFGTSDHSLACAPRSIEVTLGGANSDFYIFDRLHTVFLRCRTVLDDTTNQKKPLERSVPVHLDSLSLCFHSHAKNTRLHCIRTAFALVKYSVFQLGGIMSLLLHSPIFFSWTGPDPEHHFSTAVSRRFLSRISLFHLSCYVLFSYIIQLCLTTITNR
jgi:hypothetical protein